MILKLIKKIRRKLWITHIERVEDLLGIEPPVESMDERLERLSYSSIRQAMKIITGEI